MKKLLVLFVAVLMVIPFVARADEGTAFIPKGTIPGVETPIIVDKDKRQVTDTTTRNATIQQKDDKKKQVANPQNLQIFFPADSSKTVVK